MNISHSVEVFRIEATNSLKADNRSEYGQYFTAAPICEYMSSLFENVSGHVNLLDPGCGSGSLFISFFQQFMKRKELESIHVDAFEIDSNLISFIERTKNLIKNEGLSESKFKINILNQDFILTTANSLDRKKYSHVIMNPPYKKISSTSDHRLALKRVGVETGNLYAGFVALAIKQLKKGGEIVAIIPRSFTNGSYFFAFREFLLSQVSIEKIHIFDKRNDAFQEVLQENVIIHCIKGKTQGKVIISSSPNADFFIDEESQTMTTSDLTTRIVDFDEVVKKNDKEKFIHIAPNAFSQKIVNKLSVFTCSLDDLNIEISTGPVVDFRMKNDLCKENELNAVPLLYPHNLKESGISWPINLKKLNSIKISKDSKSYLWENNGFYLLIKRFSSKDEKRRITASIYDSSLPGEKIGFDNKLNVLHRKKSGIEGDIIKGLYIYLNSTLVDMYYRLFGGHTQINATDLRNLHYPDLATLKRMGNALDGQILDQRNIDFLLNQTIEMIDNNAPTNPLNEQERIATAMEVLKQLGMPRAQLNERSALTLLALIDLKPDGNWSDLNSPMIGVTPIMTWVREVYGKEYAPNTRETFRRQTLHQFVEAGFVVYNPDKLDRPVNSPKACYQIVPELLDTLICVNTEKWEDKLKDFLKIRQTLAQQYAMEREMKMIPLVVNNNVEIKLTPGEHSQLIIDIVTDFGPRFIPGAELLYLGDTGSKLRYFEEKKLLELGVSVDNKGKMPDVVMYDQRKNWLVLIEAVTSHGPVDGKRYAELSKLFSNSKAGLVYVTAFPDRRNMVKYLGDISWETEVWIADSPTHMIHFNGDKFLGPHK